MTFRVLTGFDDAGGSPEAMVTVRLDDPIEDLKPGMAATFEIALSDGKQGQARAQ